MAKSNTLGGFLRSIIFSRPAAGCAAALLCGLSALSGGCQQAKPASMVEALPPPNFGGPALGHPSASPPPSVVVVPPAPKPEVKAKVDPKPAPAKFVAAAPGVPREWVPYAAANTWKWIVIHHSATTVGGAARFDREHRETRHFDELGYHFVIGNGTDTSDGRVEVGSRWPKQKWGAHAQTPDEQFNKYGIGICLVGNFDQGQPSEAQMRSLSKLVAYLMKTYGVPPSHVIGHGDTKATDCPGRYMHVAAVRRMSMQLLADAGESAPQPPARTASADGELLFAVHPR